MDILRKVITKKANKIELKAIKKSIHFNDKAIQVDG